MKRISLFLITLLSIALGITSCTKDDISIDDTIKTPIDIDEDHFNSLLDNITTRDGDDEVFDLGCFTIDVPFFLNVNGDIVEINTFEDLESVFISDTINDIDTVAYNVDFEYPISITYNDGSTASIESGEALGEAFALCIPEEGWVGNPDVNGEFPAYLITELNSCYSIDYPVSLIDLSGNIYTAANEDLFIELLSTNDHLIFSFPLSLINLEGETVIASTSEELFDLIFNCDPWTNGGDSTWVEVDTFFNIEGIGCYQFIFPFEVYAANGTTITINNVGEFNAYLFNSNFGESLFVYPIQLIGIENEIIIMIDSDETLNEALSNCWGDDPGIDGPDIGADILLILASSEFSGDCYEIEYPISIVNEDSTIVSYNNGTEILNSFDDEINFELVYPVTVTLLSGSGDQIIILNEEDILNLISNCPQ